MADITFESPIPYVSISEGRRREQALGGELASNMMQSYFRAQAMRAQEQHWAEELPLHNARLTLLSAQAANEKAEGELQAIAAASAARRRESYAGLAALQEQAAHDGWDSGSEERFYRFLSTNPDFVGSKEAQSVAENFSKARLLRERLGDSSTTGNPNIWTDNESGVRYVVGPEGGMHELPSTGPAKQLLDDSGNPVPGYLTRGKQLIRVPSVAELPNGATPLKDANTGKVIPGVFTFGNKVIRINPIDLPEDFYGEDEGGGDVLQAPTTQNPSSTNSPPRRTRMRFDSSGNPL